MNDRKLIDVLDDIAYSLRGIMNVLNMVTGEADQEAYIRIAGTLGTHDDDDDSDLVGG